MIACSGMKKNAIAAPCSTVGIRMVLKSAWVLKCERIHSTSAEAEEGDGRELARIDLARRSCRPTARARSPACRPAPSPCRPRSRCSPCTAAARAAAARRCRRRGRRRPTAPACPVRKLRRANRRRSTTGCSSVSSQARKKAKPTTATTASDDDLRRVEPVELLALVEHDLQRADPQHQQRQADVVERQLARARCRACGRSTR